MGGEWRQQLLGEVAEITMGQSPSGTTCNEEGQGVPLLNGPTEFGQHHPTPVQFTTDARKTANARDILFCVRGSTTGRMNWADRQYAIGRGIASLRHRKGDEFQPLLRAVIELSLPELLAQATGSTFPNVSFNQLYNLRCCLPSLVEQKRIADILGSLDDKIELNRRMNETLEAMARALFKSWFVDFDPVRTKMNGRQPANLDPAIAALFPDSFQESAAGPVPKGWKVGKIKDCCALIQNGGTPRRNESHFWDGGTIPWLASGEVRQAIITTTESFITADGLAESSAKWVPPFSTVVALYGATAGQVAFTSSRLTTNQAVCALIPKKHFAFFNYLAMRDATVDLESKAVGSAQQNISKGIVEETEVLLPPTTLVERFTHAARPIFENWISNLHQSRTLATLRDTLLPKLLSGELRAHNVQTAPTARQKGRP